MLDDKPIYKHEPQLQRRTAWFKSKTVWAALAQAVAGLWATSGHMVDLPAMPPAIGVALQVLLGAGVIAGRKVAKGPLVGSTKAEP